MIDAVPEVSKLENYSHEGKQLPIDEDCSSEIKSYNKNKATVYLGNDFSDALDEKSVSKLIPICPDSL